MIIDERTIEQGISVELLSRLIEKHLRCTEKYNKLMDYYSGRHTIIERRKSSAGAANNRVVCNHAKYITDMVQAYLAGNPVTYSASEEFDIEQLKNVYLEQDIAVLDAETVKACSIYGRSYELVYADNKSRPRSVKTDPRQAFVVYNDDCTHIPLFGVYYYKTYNVDGNVVGVVCNVYTDANIYTYENKTDNWNGMQLTYESEHYFGVVAVIEYMNNAECQGDFEQLIPLMDAYNLLMSDRVNNKEQFVDSFLFLRNIDVDSEQAKKLKEEKILLAQDDGDAKYLSEVLSETDVEVLRDNIKEDIHRFSMVPDLSDESFGNNLSGVAIKYKLMGFEQAVKNKERYISKGLKERFKLYNHYMSVKRQMQEVPVHRVDIIFTHNLPANELETSQMISNLKDLASTETLLDQLSFVGDAKEEAELAAEEKANDYKRRISETAELAERGY